MASDEIGGYLLSLPERVARSATALAGGLLREIGDFAVPVSLRRTRLYQSLVASTLRFLIEQVGQVEGVYPSEGQLAENFIFRRAAGNGLEMIGILTFRASPVWVMAALADLSGAGRRVIQEIAASLKQEGLLAGDSSSFETMDQVLDGLERTSARVAEAINTPPLDVAGLRLEWDEIRRHAACIPPRNFPAPDAIFAVWDDLKRSAEAQQRSVFEMSALVGLSAIRGLPENVRRLSRSARSAARRTGGIFASDILDHYRSALDEIRRQGYLAYWAREFRPYLLAAAQQFSPRRRSLTERLLRRRESV